MLPNRGDVNTDAHATSCKFFDIPGYFWSDFTLILYPMKSDWLIINCACSCKEILEEIAKITLPCAMCVVGCIGRNLSQFPGWLYYPCLPCGCFFFNLLVFFTQPAGQGIAI